MWNELLSNPRVIQENDQNRSGLIKIFKGPPDSNHKRWPPYYPSAAHISDVDFSEKSIFSFQSWQYIGIHAIQKTLSTILII